MPARFSRCEARFPCQNAEWKRQFKERSRLSGGGGRPHGEVQVSDGRVIESGLLADRGGAGEGNRFSSATEGPFRLKLSLEGVPRRYTTNPTIVSTATQKHGFSFLLRDVDRRSPISIPE